MATLFHLRDGERSDAVEAVILQQIRHRQGAYRRHRGLCPSMTFVDLRRGDALPFFALHGHRADFRSRQITSLHRGDFRSRDELYIWFCPEQVAVRPPALCFPDTEGRHHPLDDPAA